MSSRRVLIAAAISISTAALVSTGAAVIPRLGVVAGEATAASGTMALYPWSGEELPVRIPIPPGWAPSLLAPTDGSYPSDRAIVANVGIRDNGYAPTLILSVDRLGPGQTTALYVEELSGRLERVSERLTGTAGEVCGRPAHLLEFSGMSSGSGDSETQSGVGIVVVPDEGPHAYIAVLQTRSLDNPGYISQRAAALSGFCIGD